MDLEWAICFLHALFDEMHKTCGFEIWLITYILYNSFDIKTSDLLYKRQLT